MQRLYAPLLISLLLLGLTACSSTGTVQQNSVEAMYELAQKYKDNGRYEEAIA
jgi:outer membrane protein assembly factor BamD (BamD/ComL family)